MSEVVLLQAPDRRPAQALHQYRVFAEALVGAAPSFVAGHGHAGRERPVDAGGPDLLRGDAGRPLHQALVAGAAESPEEYRELASLPGELFDTDVWPHVVLSGGHILCKDREGRAKCFRIGK